MFTVSDYSRLRLQHDLFYIDLNFRLIQIQFRIGFTIIIFFTYSN
jgi:hypothetical protein